MVCHPIAAQFMADNLIALFELEQNEDRVSVLNEKKHYRLVLTEDFSSTDLEVYRSRLSNN